MGKGVRSEGRKSLKLDRSRLKSASPDIGDVWLDQKRIRRQEAAALKKKDRAKTDALKKVFQERKVGLTSFIKANKKPVAAVTVIIVLVCGFLIAGSDPAEPDVLGGSTVQGNGTQVGTQDDGKTDEKPSFEPLYPSEKSADNLSVVTRKTPNGELIQTFRDYINGVEIEVTQQALPEAFKANPGGELEKLAANFQATNVIQLDSNKIFHGLDDDTDVQTLILQKEDVLIFIRSVQKLGDDVWAGYILSLNK